MRKSDREKTVSLLAQHEMPPVQIVNAVGRSPIVLSCEHAGNLVPERLSTLGLEPSILASHHGFDAGAEAIARSLCHHLDAPLIVQRYSRLVVDCNRAPGAPDLIVDHIGDHPIPGNIGLSAAERRLRLGKIYQPFHEAVKRVCAERGTAAIVVPLHSFTRHFHGRRRPWDIGLCYPVDDPFGHYLLDALVTDGTLCIGDNQPYRLEPFDGTQIIHGTRAKRMTALIEVCDDLLTSRPERQSIAAKIASSVESALRSTGRRSI